MFVQGPTQAAELQKLYTVLIQHPNVEEEVLNVKQPPARSSSTVQQVVALKLKGDLRLGQVPKIPQQNIVSVQSTKAG